MCNNDLCYVFLGVLARHCYVCCDLVFTVLGMCVALLCHVWFVVWCDVGSKSSYRGTSLLVLLDLRELTQSRQSAEN